MKNLPKISEQLDSSTFVFDAKQAIDNEYFLMLKVDPSVFYPGEDYHELNARYFNSTSGEIALQDEDDNELIIGIFSITTINVDRMTNDSRCIFDEADRAGFTYSAICELFDFKTRRIKESVNNAIHQHEFNENILLIKRIEVLPSYRGHSFGKRAIEGLIDQFSLGVGIVALESCPLQFENGDNDYLGLESFSSLEQDARISLDNLYKSIGFRYAKNCKLMVRNPDIKQNNFAHKKYLVNENPYLKLLEFEREATNKPSKQKRSMHSI